MLSGPVVHCHLASPIDYNLRQFMGLMEHGKVAVNMCDQYTDTLSGLVNKKTQLKV